MQMTPFLFSHGSSPRGSQRYARVLLSLPITLHRLMAGGVRSCRGVSLDISEGGLGALVEGSLNIGDTVAIDLKLREYELNAIGIVRHSSTLRSGFEFVGLTPEERRRIASLVENA